MTKRQKALQFMLDVASDQSHGYSQENRWGNPDYDCSSLVISAWEAAGVPVKTNGATYTGNMKAVFLKCGFKDVTKSVNMTTCAGMKPSDVLLNEVQHTAMYVGDGQIVHARGRSYGSAKPGDQGTEICVSNYYNNWDCVLRYMGSEKDSTAVHTAGRVGDCKVTLGQFVLYAKDPEIKTIQILLNAKGYKGKDKKKLAVDGELGENTAYAISTLQRKAGMKNINFGTVAEKTWTLLLK